MPRDTLFVFARAPVAGQVKTRLARAVGDEGAAALAGAFLDDVCALTRGAADRRVLAVAGAVDHPLLVALAAREAMEIVAQGEGDLGSRMAAALERGLLDGAERVAVVGSDVPLLPAERLRRAFAALAEADLVLGPADDGGYWLVGARAPVPWLFEGMAWGTGTVLAESVRRAEARGARLRLLPPWWDVDEPEDLARLRLELERDLAVAPATRAALRRPGPGSR